MSTGSPGTESAAHRVPGGGAAAGAWRTGVAVTSHQVPAAVMAAPTSMTTGGPPSTPTSATSSGPAMNTVSPMTASTASAVRSDASSPSKQRDQCARTTGETGG